MPGPTVSKTILPPFRKKKKNYVLYFVLMSPPRRPDERMEGVGIRGVHKVETFTKSYVKKTVVTWVVHDFFGKMRTAPERGGDLCSGDIVIPVREGGGGGGGGGETRLRFHLELHWNVAARISYANPDFVGVFVVNDGRGKVKMQYNFLVVDAGGDAWGSVGGEGSFQGTSMHGVSGAFSKEELEKRADELVPGGDLTLRAVLLLTCHQAQPASQEDLMTLPATTKNRSSSQLGDRLWRMREEESGGADVTLECGGEQFRVHKIVLAASSDVFSAMFSHAGTRESRTSRVEIVDMDPRALEAFLQFVYTDDCEGAAWRSREMVLRLLEAAEKYDVDGLKRRCEDGLTRLMHPGNVGATGAVANRFRAPELRRNVVSFVADHACEVAAADGPDWRELPEDIAKEAMLVRFSKCGGKDHTDLSI